jgi:hypothetical protein
MLDQRKCDDWIFLWIFSNNRSDDVVHEKLVELINAHENLFEHVAEGRLLVWHLHVA